MDRADAREWLRAKGWQYADGRLSKQYALGSFMEAIEFVNDIAAVVEGKKVSKYPTITLEGKSVMLLLADDASISIAIARLVDELYEVNYASNDEDKEDELLKQEEERERARFRSRGPYRKSSSAGLR